MTLKMSIVIPATSKVSKTKAQGLKLGGGLCAALLPTPGQAAAAIAGSKKSEAQLHRRDDATTAARNRPSWEICINQYSKISTISKRCKIIGDALKYEWLVGEKSDVEAVFRR